MPLPGWAPTLKDVAGVTPAYTRGGFDDDGDWIPGAGSGSGSGDAEAGAEQGTFTDSTSPTATHVQGLIEAACDEVASRAGVTLPERCHDLAKTTAKWHAAAAIAAGKIPGGTDDASGEYRSHISNYRACLDELIKQARVPTALRIC